MTAQSSITVSTPVSPAQSANLVAIASGKGGVGKTWLAVTLAHAMARGGKRTLLFDGDLGLANVDVQLGLMPAHDLGSVVAGRIPLEQAVQGFPEGGFDVIAGRSGSGALGALDEARLVSLRRALLALAQGYDRVVLDLGAGVETPVRVLAESGAVILVLTTDEPTSLTDAYAFIKIMVARTSHLDIRIGVNMAGGRREGERTYTTLRKACESFLKISPPLAGIIRRDPKVKSAIRHQTTIITRHPTCSAAADVESICARLLSSA